MYGECDMLRCEVEGEGGTAISVLRVLPIWSMFGGITNSVLRVLPSWSMFGGDGCTI